MVTAKHLYNTFKRVIGIPIKKHFDNYFYEDSTLFLSEQLLENVSLLESKYSNINDTLKRVIGILINEYFNSYFDEVRITVEICQLTRIPMTRLNMSLMVTNYLTNFSKLKITLSNQSSYPSKMTLFRRCILTRISSYPQKNTIGNIATLRDYQRTILSDSFSIQNFFQSTKKPRLQKVTCASERPNKASIGINKAFIIKRLIWILIKKYFNSYFDEDSNWDRISDPPQTASLIAVVFADLEETIYIL